MNRPDSKIACIPLERRLELAGEESNGDDGCACMRRWKYGPRRSARQHGQKGQAANTTADPRFPATFSSARRRMSVRRLLIGDAE